MTDNYGSTEPTDPGHESGHDEILTPEQEAVHEAPSDYEFADDHGAAAASEEEHIEDPNTLPVEAMPARRSMLPIVAAAGGVILLGAVAWWQFGGTSPTPPPPVQSSSMAPLSTAPVATSTPALSTTTTTVATSTAPVSSVAAKTSAAGNSMMMQPAPVAQVAPAPLVVQQAASSTAPEDQRIAALTTRIDDLQKALDQANQQLGQVSNMIAATAVVGSANAAPNSKDLQDRLDRMEQQIASMSSRPAPAMAAPTAMPVAAMPPVMSPPMTAASAPVVHKTAPRVVHKAATPKAATAPHSGWVLRAASPGQAWVATTATSQDLKDIHVGDTLPGVGRVTAIQQNNGTWSVQGTKGVIQ